MSVTGHMADSEALDEIEALLDGKEWDAGTAADVADVVRATGRLVRDFEEEPEPPGPQIEDLADAAFEREGNR